ncbi:MAG: 30S ribosomal protein S4 [Fusobacteria bacterium]|nr:30S ribosomal protein S4 [Fusobacteriota bacterium]
MARDRQPILKRCRNLGIDPILLGINKKSKRNIRENANTKLTEYAVQLKEKQKLKFVFGVMEKQFYKYYEEANRKDGVTGELLLQYLERRLDNVVFKLGYAKTRRQARQLVSHGHIAVNGKKIDIASYRINQGDEVSVLPNSKDVAIIKEGLEAVGGVPSWLALDKDKMSGKVVQIPTREMFDFEIREELIVEFYSR